jgi:hypothetical protein
MGSRSRAVMQLVGDRSHGSPACSKAYFFASDACSIFSRQLKYSRTRAWR